MDIFPLFSDYNYIHCKRYVVWLLSGSASVSATAARRQRRQAAVEPSLDCGVGRRDVARFASQKTARQERGDVFLKPFFTRQKWATSAIFYLMPCKSDNFYFCHLRGVRENPVILLFFEMIIPKQTCTFSQIIMFVILVCFIFSHFAYRYESRNITLNATVFYYLNCSISW